MAAQLPTGDTGSEGINDINITPFVDVVLVLLVIFMVAAPIMVRESLKVQLPKTMNSDLSAATTTIGIAVTKEGQIAFNGQVVSDENFNAELKRIAESQEPTHFLISADAESFHKDVVKVIDRLKTFNLNRFALQVERVTGGR